MVFSQKEYNKKLKDIYKIRMEIEELNFIIPKFLEITNFYFERYGFGTKIERPRKYIKIDREFLFMKKRLEGLEEKFKIIDKKIKEHEKQFLED